MTRKTHTVYGLAILAAALLGGCDPQRPTVIEPSNPTTAPSQDEASQAVLARVNDSSIPMSQLHDALVRDYGLQVAQQLIADELVRQELHRRKLPTNVTDEEIEIENRRAVGKLFQFDQPPTLQQINDLVEQLLAQKNITRRMWDATMARNALLARLAERRVKITDEDLHQEFFEEYDGKLKVRHIQVPTTEIAQEVLEKARAGADFAQLAFHYSTNPSGKTGGWLPDIGPRAASNTVPPTIIEIARSLQKPGDLSNIIQVGTNFHVLKLEEIEPPKDVSFADVQDRLRVLVREKKIQQLQPTIMRELLQNAKIEYVDPIIRTKAKRGPAL